MAEKSQSVQKDSPTAADKRLTALTERHVAESELPPVLERSADEVKRVKMPDRDVPQPELNPDGSEPDLTAPVDNVNQNHPNA